MKKKKAGLKVDLKRKIKIVHRDAAIRNFEVYKNVDSLIADKCFNEINGNNF